MNLRSIFRQPICTLAFHSTTVRWTVGGSGRVAQSGRIALPADSMSDGVILDPAATGALVAQSEDFPGNFRMQVALALPAQRTVFRVLELPRVKPSQLANLVEREIRRELPMLSENAYVSWKAVPDDGTGPQQVFVVGTARDIMDSHVAAAKAAGLHPQSADLRVIAAARAIGEADVVIAGVEDDEAELAIFRDGLPAIVRHITLGAMGGEAEWGRQLAEELTRTLKFYRDTHRDDERATTLPIRFVGDAAAKALRSQDVADVTGEAAAAYLRLVVANDGNDLGLAANVGLALKDMAA